MMRRPAPSTRAGVALGEAAPGGYRQGTHTLAGEALAPTLTRPSYHTYITCTRTMKPYRRTAQDKACIDQNSIEQSLACLPVFLAGCQTLLVVAGPTYCSRLWCHGDLHVCSQ